MRKALSLIELIFTIVIIALVFTVVPKIVFALNKSDDFSAKQDALFNGMTLMQMITRLHWDENSVTNNLILDTNSTQFKCDATTKYRKGRFIGSRNCVKGTVPIVSEFLPIVTIEPAKVSSHPQQSFAIVMHSHNDGGT